MSTRQRTSRGGTFSDRSGLPPPTEYFEPPRPPHGARTLRLAIGAIGIELSEIDDALARDLEARFASFVSTSGSGEDDVRIRVGRDPRDRFITPSERLEFNPVFLAVEGDRIRYASYRAAATFEARGGPGILLLALGQAEPETRAVDNVLRAIVAWRAVALGGALVHAAAIERDGRGYLFYGPSGAGKTTIAGANRRGTVFGDDLSLVLPGPEGGLSLVASPWTGARASADLVRRRARLAAGFRLFHSPDSEVRCVPRVQGFSELLANLPFVADLFGVRPDLLERVEASFQDVPLAHLHFRPDDSFWDAIERAVL